VDAGSSGNQASTASTSRQCSLLAGPGQILGTAPRLHRAQPLRVNTGGLQGRGKRQIGGATSTSCPIRESPSEAACCRTRAASAGNSKAHSA
jgi:hypothetical protein